MAFRVCVLADSLNCEGGRLTTFGIEFPREILAEVNTHTILSKNASSSRAIPVAKMIENIEKDPYIPEFAKNQKGMQAGNALENAELDCALAIWNRAKEAAIEHAADMSLLGAHKQIANRIIENYGWTRQVITGTEWANFFGQRTHKDAHPAFQKLARLMYVAYGRSIPKGLINGQWHLPFINDTDRGMVCEFVKNQSDSRRCDIRIVF